MSKGYTKEQVLDAIKGCDTIITTVSKRLGCNWETARNYINKWKETKRAYEDEKQKSIDMAESKLFENIKKNDTPSIKYFLSKKAKDRGYGDDETGNGNALTTAQNGAISGPILQIEIIDDLPLKNASDAILEASESPETMEQSARNEN